MFVSAVAGAVLSAPLTAMGQTGRKVYRIGFLLLAPRDVQLYLIAAFEAGLREKGCTPGREVGYSGHTALGGTHALIEAGRLPGAQVVFDTSAGLLRVDVERGDEGTLMWLEPPLPTHRAPGHDVLEVLDTLGLARAGVGGWARPAVTPDDDLLLPVADLATLRALEPDMTRLGALRTTQRARGVLCVSRETVEPASKSHSLLRAPLRAAGGHRDRIGALDGGGVAVRRRPPDPGRRPRDLHRRAGRRPRPAGPAADRADRERRAPEPRVRGRARGDRADREPARGRRAGRRARPATGSAKSSVG
jgi:hypothetical protein